MQQLEILNRATNFITTLHEMRRVQFLQLARKEASLKFEFGNHNDIFFVEEKIIEACRKSYFQGRYQS